MNHLVRASAPGKLVLTGEYAVLDGAPALAMAVNRRALITLEPADQYQVSAPGFVDEPQRFQFRSNGTLLWLDADASTRQRLALFEQIAAPLLTSKAHGPFAATLDTRAFFSSIGHKLGLGSSAALATGLSAALRHYLDLPRAADDLFVSELLQHHRKVQRGRGSGVDLAASLYGGVIAYTLEPSGPIVRRVTLPEGLQMLCVWTGKPTATGKFLAHIADWQSREPRQSRLVLGRLADCAKQAAGALGNLREFLQAVEAYGAALEQLGANAGLEVFGKAHRRIAEIAASHGAVYKPSGAGGGDVGLALAADRAQVRELAAALEGAGFQCPDVQCSTNGLTIHR